MYNRLALEIMLLDVADTMVSRHVVGGNGARKLFFALWTGVWQDVCLHHARDMGVSFPNQHRLWYDSNDSTLYLHGYKLHVDASRRNAIQRFARPTLSTS